MNFKAQIEKRLQEELQSQSIVEQLKVIDVKKIILFGSLATGDITLGSDIDLIALFNDNDNFKNRMKKVYQHIDAREGIDILAYNLAEFERMKNKPFFRYIQNQSKIVYEST